MEINIKKKEAKTITFTVTDSAGAAVNLSTATLYFGMKEKFSDTAMLVEKLHAVFGVSQAASGIVTINLTTTDTDRIGTFKGELKITFAATNIDKSEVIDIIIDDAITS